MENGKPKRSFRAISQDTLVLIGMFRALDAPDKLLTKPEAHAAIGRDPTGLVGTALKHVLHEHGMLIEWDREKQGWRQMQGADNLVRRRTGLIAVRHKAHREAAKLSVIDFTKLSDLQKVETAAVASIIGAMAHLTSTPSVKRIEGAIQKADAAGLPIGKTLALFHETIGSK